MTTRTASLPPAAERKSFSSGYLFGAPVKDFGLFATLLISFSTGFMAFFLGTFAGIIVILFANAAGHHLDYTFSYRRVGLPLGIAMTVLSLAYLGTLWVRRISRLARGKV